MGDIIDFTWDYFNFLDKKSSSFRWGSSPAIVSLMIVGFITIAFSTIWMVVILFLGMRWLRGAFNPLMSTLLNKDFTQEIRATALSVVTAITTFSIMIAEVISAVLIDQYSFTAFYLGAALFMVVVALPGSIIYGMRTIND